MGQIPLDATFKGDLEDYLSSIADSKIQTLEDLIEFNKQHAEEELPPSKPMRFVSIHTTHIHRVGANNQAGLIRALSTTMTDAQCQEILQSARERCGKNGIDKVLEENNVDVIIGPGDGPLFMISGTAGQSWIGDT